MVRYKSTYDFFFGIEHRLRREDMEDKFKKKGEARMAVCSRRTSTHQRVQAVWIASTRRVESRWRLILASGLSSTKKEGAFTSVAWK